MVVHAADALLTVEEVAQSLKVPTSWVCDRWRECASVPLPQAKLDKQLRFHKSDLLVAVFLTETQRPFVNCGFRSARIFYNGRAAMPRLKREMTGGGE